MAALVACMGAERRMVLPYDLSEWSLSTEEAYRLALTHLRQVSDARLWRHDVRVPELRYYVDGPGQPAVRALILRQLLAFPPAGVLFAVPSEEALLALPLDGAAAVGAVDTLALAAYALHRGAASPLCPHLYWDDGACVRQVAMAVDASGGLTLRGPADLEAALRGAVGLAVGGGALA